MVKNNFDSSSENHGCQMVCFEIKNPNFGYILDGLRLENVYIFYVHLEYLI
jgi:hypothetical protein